MWRIEGLCLELRYEVITQGYGKVKAGIGFLMCSDLGVPLMESGWRKEDLSQQIDVQGAV